MRRHAWFWRGLLAVSVAALGACAGSVQSSRLRAGDFSQASAEMAASLAASDLLRERGPNAPPMRVLVEKVENLTADIIPPAEQWMLMARIRASLPLKQLRAERNITFVIPEDRQALLAEAGYSEPAANSPSAADTQAAQEPTHVMDAAFYGSPRLGAGKTGLAEERSDYYYLECRILELHSRQLLWSGRFEVKRQARGLLID
ncbi:MAG: hypothetical protein IT443_07265 [Phycisphaeraceae bacterium]|nr:hypothetical protein [Phycisphaeraceae bacterium]